MTDVLALTDTDRAAIGAVVRAALRERDSASWRGAEPDDGTVVAAAIDEFERLVGRRHDTGTDGEGPPAGWLRTDHTPERDDLLDGDDRQTVWDAVKGGGAAGRDAAQACARAAQRAWERRSGELAAAHDRWRGEALRWADVACSPWKVPRTESGALEFGLNRLDLIAEQIIAAMPEGAAREHHDLLNLVVRARDALIIVAAERDAALEDARRTPTPSPGDRPRPTSCRARCCML